MTTYELASQLLAGPNIPVVAKDSRGIVSELAVKTSLEITTADQDKVFELHDEYRRVHGAWPSNVIMEEWSAKYQRVPTALIGSK